MRVRWLASLQLPRYTVFPSRSRCVGVQTIRGCVGKLVEYDLTPFTTMQHSLAEVRHETVGKQAKPFWMTGICKRRVEVQYLRTPIRE